MSILGLSLLDLLLAIGVVAVGTVIQSAVGFGLALIAAPILLLIDRELVPGPLIAAALFLVLKVAWQERQAIDVSHFRIAVLGRIIGTVPAAMLMGTVSAYVFDLLFGSLVLLAVCISLVHTEIRITRARIFFATIAAGFMSTISSIGGPPVALLYQNARGATLRANLSVFFAMGCAISLVALSTIGRFHWIDLAYSLILIVGVLIGIACSGPLRRLIDRQSARPWLLSLCAFSALVVLGRALVQL